MKDKKNIVQTGVTMKVDSIQKGEEFAAASNQVTLVNHNQQQEQSKGQAPTKAQDLFRSDLGNFKCNLCLESFYSKKEYERHSKTAIHKANRKRLAEKAVDESLKSIVRTKPCPLAHCNE